MFGEQGRPARQIFMRALMNTMMVEWTPMRDHVLKMFNYLNTLDVLGGEINVNPKLILSLSHCLTLLINLSSIVVWTKLILHFLSF